MNPRKAYAHAMWLLPKGRDPNYVDEESKWKYIKRFSQNRHRQSICVMRKKLLTIAKKSLYPTCFVLISKEKGNREFNYIKSVINFSMRLLNMSLPILMPLGNKQMPSILSPRCSAAGKRIWVCEWNVVRRCLPFRLIPRLLTSNWTCWGGC